MDGMAQGAYLDRFLAVVRAELDGHERFMALHRPQLAPDFNAVSCFYPDENHLSAIIAMLLDPKGAHGQGDVFLNIFLEIITPKDSPENTSSERKPLEILKERISKGLNIARVKSQLEVATNYLDNDNNMRRIDILLDLDGFGLAIENKPWAIDQPNQIADYHAHLSHKNNYGLKFILIYLSGNGNPPGIGSVTPENRSKMEESGHFILMSYLQLKEWCQHCAEKCRSPRVRYFLEDFTTYIRDNFEGRIPMIQEEIVIESAVKLENRSAAIAIGYSWPKIARKLIEDLASFSMKRAGLNPNEWEFNVDFRSDCSNGFQFHKKTWKHLAFKFCFEGVNTINFFYGIVSRNGSKQFLPESIKQLDAEFRGGEPPTDWWPWCQKFKPPFYDWNLSDEPWLGIKLEGETVKLVADKLEKLIQHATEEIDGIEASLAPSEPPGGPLCSKN